jgi:hypothetical protein
VTWQWASVVIRPGEEVSVVEGTPQMNPLVGLRLSPQRITKLDQLCQQTQRTRSGVIGLRKVGQSPLGFVPVAVKATSGQEFPRVLAFPYQPAL